MNSIVAGPRHGLRWLTCGLMLLHLVVPFAQARAEVTGGTVVGGAASIMNTPGALTVDSATDRVIINWNTFSTDTGHVATFNQISSNSAVLNRVVNLDPSSASVLNGTINSNGNVLLVNPHGIMVGPTGVINTNGFTASVNDVLNHDAWLGGADPTFSGNSNASVINNGAINTKQGGAALIGAEVINNGSITTEGGNISLATGGTVTLGDGSEFTHADLDTIAAGISPYAGLIRNHGTIRATGALTRDGEVYLVSPGGKIMHDGTIEAKRQISPRLPFSLPSTVYFSADEVDLGAGVNAIVRGGSSVPSENGSLADPNTVNVYTSDEETQGSIQDALDMIAENGTVNVAEGSYAGGVVHTDGVSLIGSGDATEIFGTSPAVTVLADNATVANVTLTAPGDIGVLIDGLLAPGVTGTVIDSVTFMNMRDGVRSRGFIGSLDVIDSRMSGITDDGIDLGVVTGDLLIHNNRIGTFLDPVGDEGIVFRFGISGPASTEITDNTIFADSRAVKANGIAGADVNIDGNRLISRGNTAVDLGGLLLANVSIEDNVIRGADHGLIIDAITLSQVKIADNQRIEGQRDAIRLDSINASEVKVLDNGVIRGIERGIESGPVSNSSLIIADNDQILGGNTAIFIDGSSLSRVGIVGNNLIAGGNNGIVFDDSVVLSSVSISGNNAIVSDDEDAIDFSEQISDSFITIGPTILEICGDLRFFDGNRLISGGDDGIDASDIDGSVFAVTRNNQIQGRGGSAIDIGGAVSDSFVTALLNNRILGEQSGIEFGDEVNDNLVLIARNNRIIGNRQAGIRFQENINGGITSIGGFLPGGGNNLIQGEDDGIEFQGRIRNGATVNINNNNRIEGLTEDGIVFRDRVRGSDTSINIRNNSILGDDFGIAFVGGARIDNASVTIRNNRIDADNRDAILFDRQIVNADILIRGNRLRAGEEGIDVESVRNGSFRIITNGIFVDGDGIEWEEAISGDAQIVVRNNLITAGGDGIRHENGSSIRGDASVVYRDNLINVDGNSTGIRIANVDSSNPVHVIGGEINGGARGIRVDQLQNGRDGHVVLDGLTVNNSTNTGLTFTNDSPTSTLAIELLNGVTVNGGASANDNGLVFSGPGLSLVGDTLSDLVLLGQNGNYIELRNGALFQPGMPTLIDATGVTFDGLNAAIPSQRLQIVNKIVDFIDNPTLGLIFPGAGLGEEQTYDRFTRYDDYFRTIMALIANTDGGTISVPAATITIAENLQ